MTALDDAGTPRVLVAHAGARHSYAVPSAFAQAGMLEAFYTDICGGKGLGRAIGMAAKLPLPAGIRATADRLGKRQPPADVLARTHCDSLGALRYELAARREKTPLAQRQRLIDYTWESGLRMARRGLGRATHLYNMYGFGGSLLGLANDLGVPVLTDMIIAMSYRRIVLEEHLRYPEWGPPPPDQKYSQIKGFNNDENLLETTDIYVCPSSFVADDLVDNWGIDRSRIRLLPYALGTAWFAITPRTVPGRVLFAGSAEIRKGIHTLAFAAQILKGRHDLRVAGGVHPMVLERPEAKALNFLGRVPRHLIQDEFATADVFVLPTLAEGSATVVYEAMAAGLPVITTRSAGSVIQHGVDGLIVPERDPQALADAIDLVVGDRALRDRLGQAARANVRQFNADAYAEDLRQIIRDTPSPIANQRTYLSTAVVGP